MLWLQVSPRTQVGNIDRKKTKMVHMCVRAKCARCNNKRMRKTCDAPQLDECGEDGTDARRMDIDSMTAIYTFAFPTGTYVITFTHTQMQAHTHIYTHFNRMCWPGSVGILIVFAIPMQTSP